jgi:16S rRNA (guanine(527)-N(7))-methyltransferase RsmG
VDTDLLEKILERASRRGLSPSREVVEGLVRYFELLVRWNRRINLTALPLEPASDSAIDRLAVEPLAAIGHLPNCLTLLDIGSGAGSPAIPMKLAKPDIALTMVEARTRKSAFLREAIRRLGLSDAHVETRVFGATGLGEATFDCISVRAVRMDDLRSGLNVVSRFGTSLVLFSSSTEVEAWPEWALTKSIRVDGGGIQIYTRTRNVPRGTFRSWA